MAWVTMPLLIKVEMTTENYEKLLAELDGKMNPEYIKKTYKYDGKYFKLCSEWDDDPFIYDEAKRIAKYSESTEKQVGLIFPKGASWSHSIGDLYFTNGDIEVRNGNDSGDFEKNKKKYIQKKEKFLNSFHKTNGVY